MGAGLAVVAAQKCPCTVSGFFFIIFPLTVQAVISNELLLCTTAEFVCFVEVPALTAP